MAGQEVVPAPTVTVLLQGPIHLEVVAPARQLQAVITPGGGLPGQGLQGQVGPLAGEEGNGSHGWRWTLGETGEEARSMWR